MDISVQLSIHEILAISSKVSKYLHDQIRKRQISVDLMSTVIINNTSVIININSITPIININFTQSRIFYVYSSEHVKVIIDQEFEIYTLLDSGFEVNMTSHRVFEYINLLIDIDIH